ncbi:unnamed protein product [Trifolium pratense]|uniref:Uncharacterized protein n=1 Tax=Trifolium pratense TaxID=57577 RepID=A0ACB0KZ11_TRIPR|nr:unnamed protein product [Trifolium pratense]
MFSTKIILKLFGSFIWDTKLAVRCNEERMQPMNEVFIVYYKCVSVRHNEEIMWYIFPFATTKRQCGIYIRSPQRRDNVVYISVRHNEETMWYIRSPQRRDNVIREWQDRPFLIFVDSSKYPLFGRPLSLTEAGIL